MKFRFTKKSIFLLPFIVVSFASVNAQSVGSSLTENTEKTISGTRTTVSANLLIGPNAKIQLNGDWHVYSQYIFIHPQAAISGTGNLYIYDAAEAGGAGGTTVLDANGSTINANIIHANNNAISLSNVHLPADLDTTSTWNPAYPSSSKTILHNATLVVGKNLNFSVNGANILLNDSLSVGLPNHSQGNLIIENNANIINYSANRMIVTNNATFSTVQKNFPANTNTSFFFPIGIRAGDYTPATLFTTGGNLNVSVTNYASANAPFIQSPEEGMNRIWYIDNTNDNIDSVILQHNSPTTDGNRYTDIDAYITQYNVDSTSWTIATNPGYISLGVHGTSEISAGELILSKTSDLFTPLPITWLSFTAKKVSNTAILNWQTVNEKNNKGYFVQKSTDGINWDNLGFVNTLAINGNSGNEILNYNYTDKNPIEGYNFYKLQQVDFDGKTSYSNVEKVYFENLKPAIEIYPNPTQNDMVWIKGLSENLTISVLDITGKVVITQQAKNIKEQIDLSQLSNGIYYCIVKEDGVEIWNAKLIKTK